jgi:hypothetical protein
MNSEMILQALREDLLAAQQRRERAAKALDEALLDCRRDPQYGEVLEGSQRECRRARQQVNTALMRLSNFMIHGSVPHRPGRPNEAPERQETPIVSAHA